MQHKRLADAKAHADLYIQTDKYNAAEVRDKVINFVKEYRKRKTKGDENS